MDRLFEKVAEKCKTAGFLESVMSKAHYASEDRELLFDVLGKILECMEADAAWSGKKVPEGVATEAGKGQDALQENEAGRTHEAGQTRKAGQTHGAGAAWEVVMTLGAGVDALQECYLAESKLTEAYMVEVLASEILLVAYTAYNQYVRENTDRAVSRYHFLGADAAHPLEGLPELLTRSGLAVTCTEGYCMLPKKTVAFYAELTADKTVSCEGICMGCGRSDCPNRMDAAKSQGNRTLDRPLTYGYARILGL